MAGPAVACHVQINSVPTQGNANLKGLASPWKNPIHNDRRKTGASFPVTRGLHTLHEENRHTCIRLSGDTGVQHSWTRAN